MLTLQEKQRVQEVAEKLNDKGLAELLRSCEKGGRPDAAQYVAQIVEQRRVAAKAKAVPLEVSGERKSVKSEIAGRAGQVKRHEPAELSPAVVSQVKYWGTFAGVTVGGSLAVAYVVIPALIATGQALAALAAAAAPYVIGGLAILAAALSVFSGSGRTDSEKKTGSGGGHIVNIYVNQGDQVRINGQ